MNLSVLDSEIQDFINEHLYTDITKLILNPPQFKGVSVKEIVQQIEAKRKTKTKLPTWFSTLNIFYPISLSIEQTSSEATAQYKSKRIEGDTILDATMGLGVDSYYFSKHAKSVHTCEINTELCAIAEHNFQQLKVDNIKIINQNSIEYLRHTNISYSTLYLDPSRRDIKKNKVFRFSDCEPKVVENLDLLLSKSEKVIIKSSPLIDISQGLSELRNVKEIHIVAVRNEVKELLWILTKQTSINPKITATNLETADKSFEFRYNEEGETTSSLSEPENYLYEPNAALLKSGAFKLIGKVYKLKKLHQHSHLYTGKENIEFPGRRFKIIDTLIFNKKRLKSILPKKANISIRNFPMAVSEIRKSFKIKDGGDDYLFFTTDCNNQKIVILCEKI